MMRFKNMLKCFGKIELQEDKTHPTPPLEREGVKVSCAEHTEKDLSSNRLSVLTTFKKAAFTKPSRGTSEARDEFQSTKMLNFRCWNERCRLMRGAAFTLAEVLITLAIIGVVAALTIPNVIKDYQKKQTVVQLRKVYNDINNAVKLSEIDNGPMSQWDYVQTTCSNYECLTPFLEKYYLPYFKGAQLLKNSELPNYSRNLEVWLSYSGFIRLNNGVLLNFFSNLPSYIWLIVDINGEKGPNIVGKDIFVFEAYKYRYENQKIRFWGSWYINSNDVTFLPDQYSCHKDNNDRYKNFHCGRLIELNNWEIPKDYPW